MTQSRTHTFLPTEQGLGWQTDVKPIAASSTLVWSGRDDRNTDGTLKSKYALLVELPEGGLAVRRIEHSKPANRGSANDFYNNEQVQVQDQPVASEAEGRSMLKMISYKNADIIAQQDQRRIDTVAEARTKEFKRRSQAEPVPFYLAERTHHFGQDVPVELWDGDTLSAVASADADELIYDRIA